MTGFALDGDGFLARSVLGGLLRSARRHADLSGFLAFGGLATLVYWYSAGPDGTALNYFVRLADALLHGRFWLTSGESWLNELVPVAGRFYVVYPPMPAIFLVPLVALFGPDVHQQAASVLAGGVSVGFFWLLARRFAIPSRVAALLTLVFGFGTVLWWASETGTAWVTSHAFAVCFLTAALLLAQLRRAPLLAGLLLGAAMLSRLPVVLAAPYFLAIYGELGSPWRPRELLRGWEPLKAVSFALGLGAAVAVYFAYNAARWGTIFDRGYALIPGVLEDPIYAKHGLFALEYLPRHLFAIFLRSWNYVDDPPFFQPSLWGLGLFLTTPLLLWLLRARLSDRRVAWALVATAAILVPIVTHGNVGIAQFGYRFSLDFQPLLFVVLATVFERGISRLAWVAGAASIAICGYAIWAIGIGFSAY